MATLRLGVSSYSFAASIAAGRMTPLDVVDWVAEHDADHLEIAEAGLGVELLGEPDAVAAIAARAAERHVPIVNYVVAADFLADGETLRDRIETVKRQIDVAHALGASCFRHDIVPWAWRESGQAELESVLAAVVPICRELADYAAPLGITTMVENHGFFINPGERLRRLIHTVDRPNFRALLDVGNFLCVDDAPLVQVERTLPFAALVHLKDFRIRPATSALGSPGDGWLTTLGGASILGTVVGSGELPIAALLGLLRAAAFDGPVSIEFEGPEDDRSAVERGLAVVRSLWAAA